MSARASPTMCYLKVSLHVVHILLFCLQDFFLVMYILCSCDIAMFSDLSKWMIKKPLSFNKIYFSRAMTMIVQADL